MQERILVIRLGALGDLVLCFQAFQAIRKAHPQAEIALLTMPAFAGFARLMPWFDKVLVDPRAPGWRIDAWIKLARQVRAFAPTRVYDLQGKFRQTVLFRLLGGSRGPEWSGAASGCSHPRLWPPQPGMHYTDFVAVQLERAGILTCVIPAKAGIQQRASASCMTHTSHRHATLDSRFRGNDNCELGETALNLSWLDAPLDEFPLPKKFALLIPGCAPERSYKRWPATHYAELANRLLEQGIGSVAIGTASDAYAIQEIAVLAPHVVDLSGKTTLPQVAALARRAEVVIGNDTGPTHLAAAVGARTLALMSDQVDPMWSSPRGPNIKWLQGKPLASLDVEKVLAALS
jgi:ADP-heptose:LPS heptosyltransferase